MQKALPKLHRLKTLTIGDFSYFNEEQLKMCVYRDLEIFKIDYFSLGAASIIIETSGDSLILIRKIHENCPLIEYLCLSFSPTIMHFTEFENLLKACQYLKSLLIVIYMDKIGTEENIN
ncbi:hypothetical protein RCL_jg4806.t1 [Rhizophagus clarus]|uniref:Uncharacterized protein n=1 Tax=Rhizophagus clarus TaxID=94130 RepID=A0A8H3MLA1_9GLOM|nr:hypothetical protein RCL_jg4806.t1 [Rhizophagus clarus]